jgi:outer membrane protein assembly factor BamD
MQRRDRFFVLTAGLMAFFFLCSFQFLGVIGHKKKYDTPITKDTLQPDKILFDRAIKDIEHGNYEVARLTLNTLINTYDTSEFLAKAKLAIADSWYREGGAHGLSQAEAEYKDFILFYPNMEEAAQSQYRVCEIHYKQMDKADRDSAQSQRAEDECRQVLVQFPNSKYVPQAQQMLRDVQEVLADKEYKTGEFYHKKGSFPAAANRLQYVSLQYPLYSGSDDALWDLADSYKHMGDRFRNDEGGALAKIVRDYPLSGYAGAAKERLKALEFPIPEADPAAVAHMKFEMENQTRPGIMHRVIGPFAGHPDTSTAARSGAPIMTSIRPPVPKSVPEVAAGGSSGVSDVAISTSTDTTAIDRKPDARLGVGGVATPETPAPAVPEPTPQSLTTPPPPANIGADEHKASVGSNGQTVTEVAPVTPLGTSHSAAAAAAPGTPAAALPTNHPATPAQIKEMKKQAEKAFKQAKKNAVSAAKAGAIKPAANATPATTSSTPAAPATTTPPQ